MVQIDSNEVRVTGENSFIRLAQQEGGEFTTRASHWRVFYSPAGVGHALFLQTEITDAPITIYADNEDVARWLQEEIESMLYPAFADTSLPIVKAAFERGGDVRGTAIETVKGSGVDILMSWSSVLEPFPMHVPPGVNGRSHGVYSVFFPAREASLVLNGKRASGSPQRDDRGGRESMSAVLAWAESWVRPRA